MDRRIEVYIDDLWCKVWSTWTHLYQDYQIADDVQRMEPGTTQRDVEEMSNGKKIYWSCQRDVKCECVTAETKTGAVYVDRFGLKYEIVLVPR